MKKKLKRRKDGRLQKKVSLGIDFLTGEKVVRFAYGYTEPELDYEVEQLKAKYKSINYTSMNVEEYLKWYIAQRKALLTTNDGLSTWRAMRVCWITMLYL